MLSSIVLISDLECIQAGSYPIRPDLLYFGSDKHESDYCT